MLYNVRPSNTPNTEDQNQLTDIADLQHVGTCVKSSLEIHKVNEIMVVDVSEERPVQKERNDELPQAHGNRRSTQRMLERYLNQDGRDEPWKPGNSGHCSCWLL